MVGAPEYIPLKNALAAVAVLKNQKDDQIQKLEERCNSLEQQLQELRLIQEESKTVNASLVLQVFREGQLADNCDLISRPSNPQTQLQNLYLWQQVLQETPSPEQQATLSQIQQLLLMSQLRLQPTTTDKGEEAKILNNDSAPSCTLLDSSPIQAVITAVDKILSGIGAVQQQRHRSAEAVLPRLEAAVIDIAACLITITSNPSRTMADEDEAVLQRHIQSCLQTACRRLVKPELDSAGATENEDMLQKATQKLLSSLTASPVCGIIILQCAASFYEQCITRLVSDITGEAVFPSTQTDAATTTATAANQTDRGGVSEVDLLHILNELTPFLHLCLKSLPGWALYMNSTACEEYMKQIVDAVWAATEACKIISLTHETVTRQAQRTAALMVSALHKIKSNT